MIPERNSSAYQHTILGEENQQTARSGQRNVVNAAVFGDLCLKRLRCGERISQQHSDREGADASGDGRYGAGHGTYGVVVDVADHAFINSVNADIDHSCARFHVFGSHEFRSADRGD